MNINALHETPVTGQPRVKHYFHDVSYDGSQLIKVARYKWDRVLSAQVMPLDMAMQIVKGQRRNESIIRFLRDKGHNGIVVARTSVLKDTYLNNPKTPHPEQAIRTILAPMT